MFLKEKEAKMKKERTEMKDEDKYRGTKKKKESSKREFQVGCA